MPRSSFLFWVSSSILITVTAFGQNRPEIEARYKADREALNAASAAANQFIAKYTPILEENKKYVKAKELEQTKYYDLIRDCNDGKLSASQCSSDLMKIYNQKKNAAYNEKIRAQTKVVDDLQNKIYEADDKVKIARLKLAAGFVGEKAETLKLDARFDGMKVTVQELQAESSMAQFKADTKDLLQRYELLEARFQNTAMGAYVHLKMQKLLSKDVMCKAVETCNKNGDPKDLVHKLLYTESVDSVIDKVKNKNGQGLQGN